MTRGTLEKLYLAEESKSRVARKLGGKEKRPKDAKVQRPQEGITKEFP